MKKRTTTRRKRPQPVDELEPQVVDEEVDKPADSIYADEPGAPPVLWLVVVLLAALCGFFGWSYFHGSAAPAPDAAPETEVVTGPPQEVRDLVKPIADKLDEDQDKALKVYRCYRAFADAVAGPSGKRIDGTETLEVVHGTVLDDLQLAGGVSVGAEIDAAIGGYLGITKAEDGWDTKAFSEEDQKKLAVVLDGIAWAAEQALE